MLNLLVLLELNTNLARNAYLLLVSSAVTASLTLGGCAPSNSTGTKNGGVSSDVPAPQQTAIVEFSDIPMPKRREINLNKTMVVGTDVWFGRVTFDTGQSAENMFIFYARELTSYGWKKITAVRAQTSLMTYERENRVLNIAITPNHIHGSEVRITVSPREQSISPATASPPIMGRPLPPPPTPR